MLVCAVPVLLVSSALRSVALNEAFYLREFTKYGVGQITGFSEKELDQVARIFTSYFQSEPARLDARVTRGSGSLELFNEREIQHMEDVQVLMHRVFQTGQMALAVLVLGALAIVLADPSTWMHAVLRAGAVGGTLAALVVGIAALGSVLAFDRLFLVFHYLSFANDLWLLDPSQDRLIQLFPGGFFYDAALQIGLRSAGLGALMALAGFAGLRILR